MAHPAVNNSTGLAFEASFAAEESGRPVVVAIVRATCDLLPEGGTLRLAEEQQGIELAGEPYFDADVSSYKYEPEFAFRKPATDVLLIGSAISDRPVQSLDVGLKLGPLSKVVRVVGDRFWVKQDGRVFATRPQPFSRMPLVYERAFGGWDKGDVDEAKWHFEARNPVGTGFGDPLRFVEEGKVAMPNIEDPTQLIRHYRDRPAPAGFGVVSADWQPRSQYAGTYDEEWSKNRKPLLPEDFDRRFFNVAPPGLTSEGYLSGDEKGMVVNASPVPKLSFKLPGLPPPICKVVLKNWHEETLQTNLDTVIVNTDEMRVFLTWRSFMIIPSGPHDIASIDVMPGRQAVGTV